MSISLNSVSYTYAPGTAFETEVLHQISLDIADGEFVGIMGGTGCGKSTLIQLIAGLIVPTSGQVLIDGANINARKYDRRILRSTVGVVFQNIESQLFESTVERDVAFALRRSKMSHDEQSDKARKAIEAVGLNFDEIKDRAPLALSGGEQRLIAIAGVLVSKPQVLIFDEPVAGLDPNCRENILKLMDRLNKDGTTILMVSHNADALAEHAGRIIALKDGAVFRDGKTVKVFSDYEGLTANGIAVPQTREAAQRLGLPKRTVTYKQLLAGLKTVCGGCAK